MINKFDIAIALRTYPGTKPIRTRPIFKDDKFKLVEMGLRSLKASLGNLKFKIWALLDSCPYKWEELFKKYFKKDQLIVCHLDNAGEITSTQKAIDILIKQKFSDVVYMAEDDYLYLPNKFQKMIEFLNQDFVDFITPYDHIDYYKSSFHNYKSNIKISEDLHWRDVSCTCNTYLTTKSTLYNVKDIFLRSYSEYFPFSNKNLLKKKYIKYIFSFFKRASVDADVWLSLTKFDIFNFFKILEFLHINPDYFGFYYRAWRVNWKQILFGKKWKLWCPIPSIATHLEKDFLAPGVNWDKWMDYYT
jgi:hypothetical protein